MPTARRFRVTDLAKRKASGEKVTMLTAYDALVAGILDRAGIDILLVGDSFGNVSLGYDTTLPVELSDMVLATGAVSRGSATCLVLADLPFGSYQESPVQAVRSAVALMKAGAGAVKLEGGQEVAQNVRAIVDAGIPVIGHLGYTPQSTHALGGPRLQGRDEAGAKKLRQDAQALVDAGACAIVLEMLPASLAQELTATLPVATIGIGAGPHCDGQVLVWSDMAGMTDWVPSFVKRFGELGRELENAAVAYREQVQNGQFPSIDFFRN